MNWLQRWMAGRYGFDQLGVALLIVFFILALSGQFSGLWPLLVLALLVLVYAYYRIFSRNPLARGKENAWFLRFWSPVRGWFSRVKSRIKDKSHRYYRCPQCKATLRVPKGKGKISITCPKCKTEFIKKT